MVRGLSSLCLVLILLATSQAADFPRFQPATRFTGQAETQYGRNEVELSLLDGNYFVLRQIFTSGSRRFVRDMTGTWRQRKQGSILLLSNRLGLSLPLNVGVSHHLYGGFPSLGSGRKTAITLTENRFVKPVFTMMGTLERRGKQVTICDAATGRVFQVQGRALENLPLADTLFVDVELAYGLERCELIRLRSVSREFPRQLEIQPKRSFSFVQNKVYWLILTNGQKVSWNFTLTGEDSGNVEVSGKGLWLQVPLIWGQESLRFSLSKKDAQMLTLLDLGDLRELLAATTAWALDGSDLLLLGKAGELAVLEEASLERRRF